MAMCCRFQRFSGEELCGCWNCADIKPVFKDIETAQGGERMTEIEREQNLMIVYAVEGYAKQHNLSERETLALFTQHDITKAIRKHYGALHTQDLDESVFFAEDVINQYR
jgi:hypothetical protein